MERIASAGVRDFKKINHKPEVKAKKPKPKRNNQKDISSILIKDEN
jgi:hypothetical protein